MPISVMTIFIITIKMITAGITNTKSSSNVQSKNKSEIQSSP